MKMSEQSRASIVSALKTALCRYTSEGDETVVHRSFVQRRRSGPAFVHQGGFGQLDVRLSCLGGTCYADT